MRKKENYLAVKQPILTQTTDAFRELSDRAKDYLNKRAIEDNAFCMNVSAFEIERITEKAYQTVCFEPFKPQDIKLVSGSTFPDIIAANNFGVEVKSSKTGGWKSTGSSIVESTRAEDVKKIYMLFANLSGERAQFDCKPYEQCLSGIAVTHSPRYLIDMNVEETIFDKINISYDMFRALKESDKINKVRHYYIDKARNEGKAEMPWWMGDSTEVNISMYNDQSLQRKEMIKKQMFILFPELLYGNTTEGYKKAALWLCNRYSLLCYNMRDTFSAGGQTKTINGVILAKPYPGVVGRILNYRKDIEAMLKHPTSQLYEDICDYWNFDYDMNNLYESWIDIVERQFSLSNINIRKHIENCDLP